MELYRTTSQDRVPFLTNRPHPRKRQSVAQDGHCFSLSRNSLGRLSQGLLQDVFEARQITELIAAMSETSHDYFYFLQLL